MSAPAYGKLTHPAGNAPNQGMAGGSYGRDAPAEKRR